MARPAFLSRMNELVLVATAWALPLLVLPGLLADAAELPKLAVLALSTALLAGIAISRLAVARERAFPPAPLALPMLALLLSSAVSLAGSRAPGPGYYAFLYFSAMVLAWAMASSLPSRHRLVQAMLASAGIVALYALGQFVGFEPLSWNSHFKPRVFATLGNPVFLGGFLAAIFPLAFARWLAVESEEEKDLLTLLLAVLGTALYLTWTRGSWIAVFISTAVQLAVLAASAGGRNTLNRNRAWLVTLGVLALIFGIILASPRVLGKNPVPFGDRIHDALNPKSYSVRFRLGTAEVAWKMAFAHPVTGGGLASYGAWYPLERLKTRAARGGWLASQEFYTHNDHLQNLAELGITGLGIWIWLLVCAIRWAWFKHREEVASDPLPGLEAGPSTKAQGSGPEGQTAGQPENSTERPEGYALGALGVVVAVAVDAAFNFPLHISPTAWVFFTVLGMLAVTPAGSPATAPAWGRKRVVAAPLIITACTAIAVFQVVRHIRADRAMREGEQYYGGNNHEMAEVYFGQGAELTPMNRIFHFRRSVTLLRVGAWEWRGESQDRALYHAKRAIELGLQEENAWKQLGDVYGRKEMIPRAISALEIAHRINDQREDITNNLAYYLALRNERLDYAVTLARDAVSHAPKDPTYNDTLGYVLIRSGRYAEAVAPLRLALKSLPAGSNSQAVRDARTEVLMHLDAALNRKPL
jgi:uncharacterized membrane protein